jgi:SAM-dependent methyltransferase
MKKVAKSLLRLPADALVASSKSLPNYIQTLLTNSRYVAYNPFIAAIFQPYQFYKDSYTLYKIKVNNIPETCGNKLPVPAEDKILYAATPGKTKTQVYLEEGKRDAETIRRIAEESGFSFASAGNILDLGCADGRVIRWFHDLADGREVWGVDIWADFIVLCQQHLSPPFYFATTTSFPHLPFEGNYFDFIYAISVFTHIADLSDAWLLELRRIVRPGGMLHITVHDEHTIALCLDSEESNPVYEALGDIVRRYDGEEHFMSKDYNAFSVHRAPGPGGPGEAQVFFKTDYLRRHWGRMLDVRSITPGAHYTQTAVLLQKRQR